MVITPYCANQRVLLEIQRKTITGKTDRCGSLQFTKKFGKSPKSSKLELNACYSAASLINIT